MTPIDPSRIHVLFKTHLDIGFTDDAHAVLCSYLDNYLPRALALARRLRVEAPDDRFVWTVGSWLISEALDRLGGQARADLELALAEGDIRWHALPFTMHSEYLDAGLIRHGLSLSQSLDRRFGRRTIGAKMTDVPGHSQALVPLLAEAGVELLHLGVNPASTRPQVPDWCRWRCGDDEVLLGYESDYGDLSQPLPGGPCLAFGFTGDNHGPPTVGQVRQVYHQLRERFPGCPVAASSLDTFATELAHHRAELPSVDVEIGDSWIHGTGSDPEKTRRFRALARWRAALLEAAPEQATRRELRRFSTQLMLVGEHTWGRDAKHFTPAGAGRLDGAWDQQGFQRDRADGVHDRLERSWQEQRAYLDQALASLAGSPLQQAAQDACAWPPEPAGPWEALALTQPMTQPMTHALGGWQLTLDAQGALCDLRADSDGAVFADAEHRLGELRYDVYGADEYAAFLAAYNPRLAQTGSWAEPDFGKPGLEAVLQRGRSFVPRLRQLWRRRDGSALRLDLEFPEEASTAFGCPRRWRVVISTQADAITWDVRWRDKPATRVPEALWLRMHFPLACADGLRLRKLGRDIDPRQVVADGNRALHHCEHLRWHGPGPQWRLDLPDCGLVAPGGGALVQFRQDLPDPRDGIDLNLLNTTWGTNFPLWYEDDGVLRLRLVREHPCSDSAPAAVRPEAEHGAR
ncbi:MAG: DUF5054 domain-containing protein [Planctomycetota bacterium]|jgi:hypothetical protein|nr:DUF5054 domain-containing protein [Planctomycetota bacterium]